MPSSKKTRALLAYLVVTARPHSRERLCELFWDKPDDPRGALRWSLSKLRKVLNGDGYNRVIADREHASIDLTGVTISIASFRDQFFSKPGTINLDIYREIASQLNHVVLDGMDMPNQVEFQAWLMAYREEVQALKVKILKHLALYPNMDYGEGVNWARRWLEADPLNAQAVKATMTALRHLGRFDEGDAVLAQFQSLAQRAGVSTHIDFTKADDTSAPPPSAIAPHTQNIQFCETPDHVRIAYADIGNGPPLVKAANWLNHLELDFDSPIWGDTFRRCASQHSFIRYDERGNGLSDWDVNDISQAKFVEDLETVVDHIGLKKFPLLGISQGCAVSIEYAVRHPERVSALILIAGYASGWRIGVSDEEKERREAVMTLTKLGWGKNNPAYRQIFSQTFMPDATPEDLEWFNEFQRQTTSPENAVKFQRAFGDIDVRHLLSQVRVPTIVLHARHDQRISLEQGRELAVGIPGARFVPLESKNHILLGHEKAWHTCFDAIDEFLAEHNI